MKASIYLIILLIFVSFGIIFLGAGTGIDDFSSLFSTLLGNGSDRIHSNLIWEIRIPKLITAFIAGSALGISGLLLQTFFQNPLAGPFVLGIHSGASLGVAFWIFLLIEFKNSFFERISEWGHLLFSFIGSFLVLLILIGVAKKISSKVMLLVIGLIIGYFSGGIINILVSISGAEKIKNYLLWTLGSFQRVGSSELLLFSLLIFAGLFVSFLLIKPLNALSLGETYAKTLGISVSKVKIILVAVTSWLTSIVISFCGPIVFIGILSPHLVRFLLKSADHKKLLPFTLITGGLLAVSGEFISSSLGLFNIPINAVLGLIGAPLLIFFILFERKGKIS